MTALHSVVIVDDQAPFRQAAKAVLRRLELFRVRGRGFERTRGDRACRRTPPGAGTDGYQHAGNGGDQATRRILSAHPEVVVFLCSTYDVEDLPSGAAGSGASAYVNKERFGAEMLRRLWADRAAGPFQTA